MAITIQPTRVYEGHITGPVDTPEEALVAHKVKAFSPKEVVDRLMASDDGRDDLSPGKGIVASTFAVVSPTQVNEQSVYLLNAYKAATPGYDTAGEAGALLKYDPATRKPLNLQIADKLGKITIDVKYKDGEVAEITRVLKSVKFPNDPAAVLTTKLTVTGEGEHRVTTLTADGYKVIDRK